MDIFNIHSIIIFENYKYKLTYLFILVQFVDQVNNNLSSFHLFIIKINNGVKEFNINSKNVAKICPFALMVTKSDNKIFKFKSCNNNCD